MPAFVLRRAAVQCTAHFMYSRSASPLFQVNPGERARSTSCQEVPSRLSHRWHLAPARSILHSWQVSCRFNHWRNSRLHRRIFLSCRRSVGTMTSGCRNMQLRCKPVRHGQATRERVDMCSLTTRMRVFKPFSVPEHFPYNEPWSMDARR